MKAIEQYFHVALFIMLYKLVLTFKSVDKTLVCDHSTESYWVVISCGAIYYAVQGGSNSGVSAVKNILFGQGHTLLSSNCTCLPRLQ